MTAPPTYRLTSSTCIQQLDCIQHHQPTLPSAPTTPTLFFFFFFLVPLTVRLGDLTDDVTTSIVVAVGSPWANVFGAMQLLPDGSPDDTFGLHGRARIDLDGRTSATDLLLQSDGKVVIVGFVRKRMLAVRFAIDGSLDATFGGNGKVAVGFPDRAAVASSAALTPDGKIVLAGTVSRSPSKHKMVLVRLTAQGELDSDLRKRWQGRAATRQLRLLEGRRRCGDARRLDGRCRSVRPSRGNRDGGRRRRP